MNVGTECTIRESLNSMFDHPDGHMASNDQILDMFTTVIEQATRGMKADREMLAIRRAVGLVNPEKDFPVDVMAPLIENMRRDSVTLHALRDEATALTPEPETDAQREFDGIMAELLTMGHVPSVPILLRLCKAWVALTPAPEPEPKKVKHFYDDEIDEQF
jgi:hypothetical protein